MVQVAPLSFETVITPLSPTATQVNRLPLAGALLVNNSGSWVAQSIGTGANLAAITYTTQFAVLDATGNIYVSRTGVGTWQGPLATGIGSSAAITTDGRGYLALGHGGDNATSF